MIEDAVHQLLSESAQKTLDNDPSGSRALAKERRADAHDRAALGDGIVEVPAHPHRELGQAGARGATSIGPRAEDPGADRTRIARHSKQE